jgi:hypothetical protein
VVEGVGTASIGTEFVVGICDAVGVTFWSLPSTLFWGGGMGCGPET